ncbi:spectrin alpha chain, erythrocytic 1-like, partial [Octodon degus]|uniref:Spectrin alpha chain, erythrocytic 1-like n=1 Tax=Octodon degus TaxID=10160 RepID=A0A6P6DXM2_OCTDE
MESSGPKVLETAEEIHQRRHEVLDRYHRFKERVAERGQKLDESYRYQVFRQDADDLEKWILEKIKIVEDKSYKDIPTIEDGSSSRQGKTPDQGQEGPLTSPERTPDQGKDGPPSGTEHTPDEGQ